MKGKRALAQGSSGPTRFERATLPVRGSLIVGSLNLGSEFDLHSFRLQGGRRTGV